MSLLKVFQEIKAERQRQDTKFGEQNHNPFIWLSVLGEEVGEVHRAALEARFRSSKGFDGSGNWAHYRKELIQVAAVAVSMIECFDRKHGE